jgi:hypothetical protein
MAALDEVFRQAWPVVVASTARPAHRRAEPAGA